MITWTNRAAFIGRSLCTFFSAAATLCCTFFALAAAAQTTPQAAPPPQVEPSTESLAPRPPTVVQNRFFKKALRPEISIFGGTVLNEAYSSTYAGGLRLGMFFNEYFGIDYAYTHYSATDSNDLIALSKLQYYKDSLGETKVRVQPSFVRLKNQHAAMLSFIPIYGKINLLDKVILYSDLYVSAGGGLLSTTDGNKSPLILGFGQRFFFAKYFSIRIDAWDHIFSETRVSTAGKSESTRHAWLVAIGASAFLWTFE